MTAAEGIRLAGLHPATLPLVMLPLIRARVAHQSCRQPCGQLPFPRVFPSHSQQTNCCGRTAQPSYSLTPRLNPHSLRHSRRTTRHRDFVLWRFLAAGRQSAWSDHRCRQPKTCTTRLLPQRDILVRFSTTSGHTNWRSNQLFPGSSRSISNLFTPALEQPNLCRPHSEAPEA